MWRHSGTCGVVVSAIGVSRDRGLRLAIHDIRAHSIRLLDITWDEFTARAIGGGADFLALANNATVVNIDIAGGAATPTIAQTQGSVGERVIIRVNSDGLDQLHVHSVSENAFQVERGGITPSSSRLTFQAEPTLRCTISVARS